MKPELCGKARPTMLALTDSIKSTTCSRRPARKLNPHPLDSPFPVYIPEIPVENVVKRPARLVRGSRAVASKPVDVAVKEVKRTDLLMVIKKVPQKAKQAKQLDVKAKNMKEKVKIVEHKVKMVESKGNNGVKKVEKVQKQEENMLPLNVMNCDKSTKGEHKENKIGQRIKAILNTSEKAQTKAISNSSIEEANKVDIGANGEGNIVDCHDKDAVVVEREGIGEPLITARRMSYAEAILHGIAYNNLVKEVSVVEDVGTLGRLEKTDTDVSTMTAVRRRISYAEAIKQV